MINQLIANIKKTGAPIVVGLDPMLKYIPEHIQKKAFVEFGETLEGAAEAIWQFNKEIVDKTYDLIPAVKPQIAMYEQFGIPGLVAFKKTVDYCKSKGLVVIGDIKRGDIGSTSSAYAVGHIGKVQVGSKTYAPFDEDFVTVNPYLGSDGVNPFIDVCKEEKKGLFILVKTSNPSSGEFQDQMIDGRPLYELVGEKVAQWGEDCMGDEYSYIGAVVGATYPEMGKVLRKVMPKSYILVPGYAKDYVECMWLILQNDKPEDFVIATGVQHSVREFCQLAFHHVGIELDFVGEGENEKGIDRATGKVVVEVSPDFYRPTDVVNLWGDPTKAKKELGWNPMKTSFEELVKIMVDADMAKVAVERAGDEIRMNLAEYLEKGIVK